MTNILSLNPSLCSLYRRSDLYKFVTKPCLRRKILCKEISPDIFNRRLTPAGELVIVVTSAQNHGYRETKPSITEISLTSRSFHNLLWCWGEEGGTVNWLVARLCYLWKTSIMCSILGLPRRLEIWETFEGVAIDGFYIFYKRMSPLAGSQALNKFNEGCMEESLLTKVSLNP